MHTNEFFLVKSDIDTINKNIQKKRVLLIGGYNGYGKNFGDIIQAKSIIKFYSKKGFLPFILLHLHPIIKEGESIEEYKRLFPEAILIFWGNNNEEIRYLDLVSAPNLHFDILHLYGGGFLNEFWGKVVIESVEKSFQTFKINKYFISGQQISEKIVPALKKHIEYYQPLIIGTRDYDSIGYLNKYEVTGIFSGDDSLEYLEKYSSIFKQKITLGTKTCLFHLNISDYTHQGFTKIRKEIQNLISFLRSSGIEKFVFFHSYTRNSAIVKDTLKALDYLGVSSMLPYFDVISLPALLLREDELDRTVKELENLGNIKYAFSMSYHTALFFALSGIPTYLFAFNQYYSQKQRGLYGREITLLEFLSNTNEIYKIQQKYLKNVFEERKRFLELLNEKVENDEFKISKYIPEITYTSFPVESRELAEIDNVISSLYLENQKLRRELDDLKLKYEYEIQHLQAKVETLENEKSKLGKDIRELEDLKLKYEYKVQRLQTKIEMLESEKNKSEKETKELEDLKLKYEYEIQHLQAKIETLENEKNKLFNELNKIYNSRGWKVLEKYYTIMHRLKKMIKGGVQ